MFTNFAKIFLFLICFSIALLSCEFSENEDEGKLIVKEVVEDIDTVTFWYNKAVYIIRKPDFKINDMLIIQNGTCVKFDPAAGRSITVTDFGYISAQGQQSKPVIFTSLYDPDNGALAHKSSYPPPKPGDWDAIYLKGKTPSSFMHTKFIYGGGGPTKSSVVIDSAYALIEYCYFFYNKGGNINDGLGVINAAKALPKVIISYCKFYNNELPLTINSLLSVQGNNIFYNPENIEQSNKYNAIVVVSPQKINLNVYWEENNVPFVIRDSIFEIGPKAFLSLNNNVVLKFFEGTTLLLADGIYSVRNQNGRGVAFTSINDDSLKGDSRADKLSKLPAAGDWFIKILENEADFEWTNIFYAKKQ